MQIADDARGVQAGRHSRDFQKIVEVGVFARR